MPKYFAFLRAINVGGHTVKMDVLRSLFEECGCSNVETFIASGNVIFEAGSNTPGELAHKIESHLSKQLSYTVVVFLRTTDELTGILKYKAFPDDGTSTIYIAFLSNTPDDFVVEKFAHFNTAENEFRIHNREVYWLCRTRFSDSSFSGSQLEKTLGMPVTIRNLSTLKKMVRKYVGSV